MGDKGILSGENVIGKLTMEDDNVKLSAYILNWMKEKEMSQAEKVSRLFKALSVETRVRMLELLKKHSLCVNALARSLAITPPAVSQHLRILREADILIAERKGYFVHYRVNPDKLAELSGIVKRLFE